MAKPIKIEGEEISRKESVHPLIVLIFLNEWIKDLFIYRGKENVVARGLPATRPALKRDGIEPAGISW